MMIRDFINLFFFGKVLQNYGRFRKGFIVFELGFESYAAAFIGKQLLQFEIMLIDLR